jgi:hypothetical protein
MLLRRERRPCTPDRFPPVVPGSTPLSQQAVALLGGAVGGALVGALVSLFTTHLSRRHDRHLWLLEKRLRSYRELDAALVEAQRAWSPGGAARRPGAVPPTYLLQQLSDRRDLVELLAPGYVTAQADRVLDALDAVTGEPARRDRPSDPHGDRAQRFHQVRGELLRRQRLDVQGRRNHWWQRLGNPVER